MQQPYNHDSFSKIWGASTALQSRLFCKNIENFLCKYKIVNNCTIPSMHAERKITFLINTLLLHIALLALTDRQNDWQRNKYTHCAWAGGTFFPVVPLCQFFSYGVSINFFWTWCDKRCCQAWLRHSNRGRWFFIWGSFLRQAHCYLNKWNTALKEAGIVSKMRTPAITLWFSEQCWLGFLF